MVYECLSAGKLENSEKPLYFSKKKNFGANFFIFEKKTVLAMKTNILFRDRQTEITEPKSALLSTKSAL